MVRENNWILEKMGENNEKHSWKNKIKKMKKFVKKTTYEVIEK